MRPWKRAETPTCGTRSRTDHEISSATAPAPAAAAAATRRALLAAALGARALPPADDEMSWQASMVRARPMMIARGGARGGVRARMGYSTAAVRSTRQTIGDGRAQSREPPGPSAVNAVNDEVEMRAQPAAWVLAGFV